MFTVSRRHVAAGALALCATAGAAGGFLEVHTETVQTSRSRSSAPAAIEAPQRGISEALAQHRSGRLQNLEYDVAFTLPADAQADVTGSVELRFDLTGTPAPLPLDFAPDNDRPVTLALNGTAIDATPANGHIVLPEAALIQGRNTVSVTFTAGNAPLNRNPAFLYTIFVPARAHLAFPSFDQPDLKARFALRLTMPEQWQAVANGREEQRLAIGDGRVEVRFAQTLPIPTYLFAFAAGEFRLETAERGARRFRMLHRETDDARLARNRGAIFDLHASALEWLERYTAIPYPFGKFDFVLMPAFQFSGMEHPGSIFYNASLLLLDETATQAQRLARASLIAHETSHMWFGDLVTMKWFDDVWTKEVFANFIAAKIVNPSFPEIDHELRFLLTHYPQAYDVDRTAGTNAIRQPLSNLNEAGSLYGAIVYQKAPIVMRQLEQIVGVNRFREGLQEYLRRYSFANATWRDLIDLLDEKAEEDLARWSRVWVEEEGRPTVSTELRVADGAVEELAFRQRDPLGRNRVWPQRLRVTLGYPRGPQRLNVNLDARRVVVPEADGLAVPDYVLAAAGGIGYGLFRLDARSLAYLLANVAAIEAAVDRGAAWVTLWDALLEGDVQPVKFFDLAVSSLPREADELNVQRILGYAARVYWKFLTPRARAAVAPRFEQMLREGIDASRTTSQKSAYFSAFREVVLTEDGVRWLWRVWKRDESIEGLTFSETDEIAMAQELALRNVPDWKEVLAEQLRRIENPDRRDRFAFVTPAFSADVAERAAFFESLKKPENRCREPWVLDAVTALHHPLRDPGARRYVRPSLQLLREIQQTGDIFFPKRWMDATLGGHQSAEVAGTVRRFLANLPRNYPDRLRRVILSSADELFRAERLTAISRPPRGTRSKPPATRPKS